MSRTNDNKTMANQPTKSELSENVRSLLAALRLRVKLYVWFEGLAVAVLWMVLSFWFTYLVDYWVLVRGFAIELARGVARAVAARYGDRSGFHSVSLDSAESFCAAGRSQYGGRFGTPLRRVP